MLATFNILAIGAPKIWYIVPNHKNVELTKFLRQKNLLNAIFTKRCFVEVFLNGYGNSISFEEMV
jgi:hypothetical protein